MQSLKNVTFFVAQFVVALGLAGITAASLAHVAFQQFGYVFKYSLLTYLILAVLGFLAFVLMTRISKIKRSGYFLYPLSIFGGICGILMSWLIGHAMGLAPDIPDEATGNEDFILVLYFLAYIIGPICGFLSARAYYLSPGNETQSRYPLAPL